MVSVFLTVGVFTHCGHWDLLHPYLRCPPGLCSLLTGSALLSSRSVVARPPSGDYSLVTRTPEPPVPPPPYRRPTRLPFWLFPCALRQLATPPFIGSLSALCHLVNIVLFVNPPAVAAVLTLEHPVRASLLFKLRRSFSRRLGSLQHAYRATWADSPVEGRVRGRLGDAVASYSELSPMPRCCGRASPNLCIAAGASASVARDNLLLHSSDSPAYRPTGLFASQERPRYVSWCAFSVSSARNGVGDWVRRRLVLFLAFSSSFCRVITGPFACTYLLPPSSIKPAFAPSEQASVTPQSQKPPPASTDDVPFSLLYFFCLAGIYGAFHPTDGVRARIFPPQPQSYCRIPKVPTRSAEQRGPCLPSRGSRQGPPSA